MRCLAILLLLSLLNAQSSGAQDTLPPYRKDRLRGLVIGSGVAYAGTLTALSLAWYANEPRSRFHFFDDNAQWLQMDKVGHFYSAYGVSRLGVQALRWTGLPRRKADRWGSLSGVFFQTPIEVLDGFSAAYGASWGDLVANTAGSGLVYGQLLLWDELRLHPRFSFRRSPYAALRPNTLGDNLPQEILKDYNGQTYWLGVDLAAFLPHYRLPPWLNLAVGYGGEGMVQARRPDNEEIGYDMYRQYYLSLDVNFTRIPTRHKGLKSLFFVLNAIKIPAPTLEFNRKEGFRGHWLYF